MSDHKSKFAAIVSVSAEMGASVGGTFGKVKKAAKGLDADLKAINDKRAKLALFGTKRGAVDKAQASFDKRAAALKKAEEAMHAAPGDAKALGAWQKHVAALDKTRQALEKEKTALVKLDDQLKQSGVNTNRLAEEEKRLGVEASRVQEKLARRDKLNAFASSITKIAVSISAVSAATTAALFVMDKNLASNAKSIKLHSEALRMSVEDFQSFQLIARKSGMDMEAAGDVVAKAFTTIDRAAMGKATSRQAKALAELGLSAERLRRVRPDAAMDIIANRLQTYAAKKGKMSFATIGKLFFGGGIEGVQFATELSKAGAKGRAELIAKALESGEILKKQQVDALTDFKKQLSEIEHQWEGMKNQIAAETAPVFTEFLKTVAEVIHENGPEIVKFLRDAGAELKGWTESGEAKKDLKEIGRIAGKTAKQLESLIRNLGGVKVAAAGLGLGVAAGPVTGLITSLFVASKVSKIAKALTAGKVAADVATKGAAAAEGATGAGAAAEGAGFLTAAATLLTRLSAWTLPLMIKGDQYRPDKPALQPRKSTLPIEEQIAGIQKQLELYRRVIPETEERLKNPPSFAAKYHLFGQGEWQESVDAMKGEVKRLEAELNRLKNAQPKQAQAAPGNKTANVTQTFNITVNAAPGQDPAKVATDTQTQIQREHGALSRGFLFDGGVFA